VTLLYFAWVRQSVGCSEENLPLPDNVRTIEELITYLRARGGPYEQVFGQPDRLRAALNREHVRFDANLHNEDEIAFFPPVTGG